MWAAGEVVQDRRTGRTGEVVQVTGPAPFLYRVMVCAEGGLPLMIYRYGDQLRRVADRSVRSPRA